jgi:hypothetical protein
MKIVSDNYIYYTRLPNRKTNNAQKISLKRAMGRNLLSAAKSLQWWWDKGAMSGISGLRKQQGKFTAGH